MQEIRAGVWQFEPQKGAPQSNLDALAAALESREAQGLDLVVAPEMFLSGWEPKIFEDRAMADPAWVQRVGSVAKRAGCAVAASVLTRGSLGLQNTFHLWDAKGKVVGTQHKMHLWGREAEHLVPASSMAVIEASFGRVGGVICYDVEFPEVSRRLALHGAEVLIVPAAFWSSTSWDVMTRARALENNCFLLAANQIGGDAAHPHNGQSRIVDPFGNVRAEVPFKTSGIAAATLDPSRIAAAREWAPFLRDLRMRSVPENAPRH